MSTVSRLSLPSEFSNPVNAALLVQPQPQFLYAMLLLQDQTSYGPNASRVFASSGAPIPDLGSFQLDLLDPAQRDSVMLRGAAISVMQFPNARPMDSVTMMRPNFVDSTYTEASRRTTRATISTTSQNILGMDSVSIKIDEFSGPYNSAAGAVQPLGLEGFDLSMSPTHNLIELAQMNLRRDRMKTVDSILSAKMFAAVQTSNYVYAGDPNSTLTSDNSAFLSQGDRPLDVESIQRSSKVLRAAGIPTFANGRYMAVISNQQALNIKSSSSFQRLARYFEERNPLFTNYVATVDNVDIFECATNPTATANSTITVQLGIVFGPGLIGYAMAKPCQVAAADETNYGRRVNVIWTAWEGSAVLDDRFAVALRSD
jgi:hypothetical protein